MAPNFVALIKQYISPIVMDNEVEQCNEKEQVIQDFLPLFLMILKLKPYLIEQLDDPLHSKIHVLFDANPSVQEYFLLNIKGQLETDALSKLLNNIIDSTLTLLHMEVDVMDPEAIQYFLQKYKIDIQQALPTWAPAVLGNIGAVNNLKYIELLDGSLQFYEEYDDVEDERFYQKYWLALLLMACGFLVFLSYWWGGYSYLKTSHAADISSAIINMPATFEVSTNAKGYLQSCKLYSHDDVLIKEIQKTVQKIFKHPIGCSAAVDSAYNIDFMGRDRVGSVMQKIVGIPNISLSWAGNKISLQVPNKNIEKEILDELRPLVGSMVLEVEHHLNIDQEVNQSIQDAKQALDKIQTQRVNKAFDVASALNLQIINFENGSAVIPKINMAVLDQAAELMQSNYIKLVVTGHTDAFGDAQENMSLSKKRAQSVLDYLLYRGVDAKQLKAIGRGQTEPKTTNMTEEGQFKNRRIEFEVLNTKTDHQIAMQH